ncbi:MAG: hypothetical protein UR66_C0003G0108 [Candidatus Moranbacteria bacterium GW2011_GWE1_35_17]|nr:MAG: hypothetical protein UR65_C0081G0003 [Candidatus Moranbacteria bacterium GW2011_GWE2_35_164]KKP68843.1 MAG: hypothetical protein UR66_C0003G0108 [Candidatus Moranbacteria bacterium GW2011_GWE1_35_17]KKP82080.1 MAG: hypothetical protein UR82_C0044G0012 [Candidatus Moranbacteria bacterium GW2011_GWF1_35_5]KKP84392.1 MAG: hypothetical protein UR83_C0022G0029 [Candidatus Moranbacteria bacterium GW2011_GWF2_35_54]
MKLINRYKNMKKVSLILGGLFLIAVLAGCGKNEKIDSGEQVDLKLAEESAESLPKEDTGENKGGMMEKLKNSISKGKKMKCTYKISDENGATEVTTYAQGEKYKTEVNLGQMKTVSVFDGDVMYSWSAGQKVGTKMAMDCINSLDIKNEATKEADGEASPDKDDDNFVDALSGAENLNCEDAGDVDFSIPDDIKFSDQCEMLKSQQKILENLNK